MEIKEVLIRVWGKMNCKEMIKKYNICANCNGWTDRDAYTISYHIPCPTKVYPEATKFNTIRFVCLREKGMGFTEDMYSNNVAYPCTEKEAIELKYIFHQIKNKLEEIRRDELLELL